MEAMSHTVSAGFSVRAINWEQGINNEVKGCGSVEFWQGPSKHVLLL